MAFPPNYRQERQSRDRAKQQKAAQKQAERDAKKAERKQQGDTDTPAAPDEGSKD
jgi:hypothetical protein